MVTGGHQKTRKVAAYAVNQTREKDPQKLQTSERVVKQQPQSVSCTPTPGSKRYGYLGQDQSPRSSLAH
jgi:hypothetical protein